MRMNSRHIIPLVLSIVILAACKPTVPQAYLQPDDMEDILYDYFVAQGMAQIPDNEQLSEDYRRDLYFNAVLKKYGISRADFDSSLVYYHTRADYFMKIYKRVLERMNERALELGTPEGFVDRYVMNSLTGDTSNVWTNDRYVMLLPYAPYNRMQFTQEADTSYHAGDSFMLTFKSDFLYQGGMKDVVAYMAVKYVNDSIVSSAVHFSTSGMTQLRINPCEERVKEITGYLYMGDNFQKSPDLRMLFLTNIQLIRFHKKEDSKKDESAAPETKPEDDAVRHIPDSLRPRPHRLGERPLPQPDKGRLVAPIRMN